MIRSTSPLGTMRRLAWIWPAGTLLIGLILTAILTWGVNRYVTQVEQQRFNRYSERVSDAIVERVDDLQRLLLAGRGLFDASTSVEHAEWEAFSRSIDFDYYHGMMGVGFIQRVPKNTLDDFVRMAGKDAGLPMQIIQLNPTPQYPDLYVIRFIEPLSRNGPARGLDVGSEQHRREAAEAAMRSGKVAFTKRITLIQDRKRIAGFLLYAPVYRTRHVPESEAEREQALYGWTYMPVRITEIMEGVMQQVESMVDFEVFEGTTSTREALLFDADGHFEKAGEARLTERSFGGRTFHRTDTLSLYGQTWTIHTSSRPEFDASANTELPRSVAVSGVAISLLVALVAWSLARTRARALSLAEEMMQSVHEREIRLRDSEEQLSAILNSAMDAIITIQADGNIAHFNPAAELIFGYRADEVRGRNVNMLMPEPYHSAHDGYLAHYQASGMRRIIGTTREVTGQRKDGSIFPMELAVSEVQVQGQTMFTGIVRDITERQKVDRMKSEFVSTVSHELRTPLTSIRGSLGLIVGGAMGEVSDQVRSLLDIAQGNAERLVRLINDILDMEKIESGRMSFKLSLQPLQPLIEQALAANQGYAEQHHVTLEEVRETDDVWVEVDSDRFIQVMNNLLSNAIKYSVRGGVVTVQANVRAGRVLIEVIDRGAGVPAEFKDRIFQKFSQADSSDTRAKGGTGLGLAIVKSLVERMGGSIDFTSTPGAGANFFFDLPIRERAGKRAHAAG